MPKRKKNNICPKVLFYTSLPRLFRITLIGHLYEISQVYPVVLLSEKLDSETEKILYNKKLFPKLQKIIPVRQYTDEKMSLLAKYKHHKYLCRLAKNVIRNYKPDIIIALTDFTPFEMYFMRFAKRIKTINICFQASLQIPKKQGGLWSDLIDAHLRLPAFLPVWTKLILMRNRKYLGHFFYYWFMPLMMGQMPFWGKSSYIIWSKRKIGLRDADYYVVFSKRDYNICVNDGVPLEKLYILSHPLKRETKNFFDKIYFSKISKSKEKRRKVLTLMLPGIQIGFRRSDYSLIPKEEIRESRIQILTLITKILKKWKIFIKPHPATAQDIVETFSTFESISDCIKVTDPHESADKYIEMSDVIVGLPPSSTTLFTASLRSPEKIILSLDLNQELLGDSYKDFEGIKYINTDRDFTRILGEIQDNRYHKMASAKQNYKEDREFLDISEMIECLFYKKK